MLKHYIIQTAFTDRYELDAEDVQFVGGFVLFTVPGRTPAYPTFDDSSVVGAFFQPTAVICTPIAN